MKSMNIKILLLLIVVALAGTVQAWFEPLISRLGGGSYANVVVVALAVGIFAALAILMRTTGQVSEVNEIVLPPIPPPRLVIPLKAWLKVAVTSALLMPILWGLHGFAFDGVSVLLVFGLGLLAPFCVFVIYVYAKEAGPRQKAERNIAVQNLEKASELEQQAKRQLSDGAVADAIAAYEAALAISRQYRPKNHIQILSALMWLSRTFVQAGQFDKAIIYGREALSLCEARTGLADPSLLGVKAVIERTIGEARVGRGEYAAAQRHFETSGKLWRSVFWEANDKELDVMRYGAHTKAVSNFLILTVDRSGDSARAIDLERRMLASSTKKLKNSKTSDLARIDIMALAAPLVEPEEAITFSQQALCLEQLAHGERGEKVAEARKLLGDSWQRFGGFDIARHHYLAALNLAQEKYGRQAPECASFFVDLGGLAERVGNHAEARRHFEQALVCARAGADEEDIWNSCIGLAEALLAENDLGKIRGLIKEAMERFPGGSWSCDRAYSALSELHAREGSLDAAILLGKSAVSLMQRELEASLTRQLEKAIREERGYIPRRLAEHLVDAGRLAEAQQVLDLFKEREYEDFVTRKGEGAASSRVGVTPGEASWIRHGDDLEAAISALASERRSLLDKAERSAAESARLEALHDLLDKAKHDLDDWLDGLVDMLRAERSVAQEQVRGLNLDLLETLRGDLDELGPAVALVHFILGARRLAIILTKPDIQVSRDVAVTNVDIHRLLHHFRREIRLHSADGFKLQNLSRDLYQYLIAPIAEHLADVETLMVVLDGALRYLPLAALHDGSAYLIEKCALTILTAASHTRLKDRPLDWAAGGVGGLGVSRGSQSAAPLAAVGNELRAIIREGEETEGVYPGKRYLDAAFTAAALVDALHAHKAIHIASHFEFAAANDAASTLLLGDGTELTLRQLQADRFTFRNVELVTLSACETALGTEPTEAAALQGLRRMNGMEFESLGAMIQKRGAKAVIATLWAVEDNSTATFMKQFYRARRDGESKAAALRSAQLALLRGGEKTASYAHPYFWAPFVLMGNWQ